MTSQFLLPYPFEVKTLDFTLKRDPTITQNNVYFSPTMQIGPTNWCAIASFEKDNSTMILNLEIFCNKTSTLKFWECNANIKTTLAFITQKEEASFSSTSRSVIVKFSIHFSSEEELMTGMNDVERLRLQIEVDVKSYVDLRDFSKPDPNLTQCALLVEGHKLHINKYLLAEHSPYFRDMFLELSGFEENDEEEIEIKDVVYREFIEFLNICYSHPVEITAENIGYLLKLGDRFQHRTVMEQCVTYLHFDEDIDEIDILQYAHDYKLQCVQNNRLSEFETEEDILDACSNYDKIISPEVAHLLFEKLMKMGSIETSLTSPFLLLHPSDNKTLDFPLKRGSMLTGSDVYFSPTIEFDDTNWFATASFDKTVRSFPTYIPLNLEIFCDKTSTVQFWECEAHIKTTMRGETRENKASFSEDSRSVVRIQFGVYFETEEEMMARINDGTLTLQIEVFVSVYNFMMDFSKPDPHLRQCAFLVEGHKLYINKYLLAEHSPYFYAMFFSGFGEKDKQEIEMKDVVYKEFVEFLIICHNHEVVITDKNIGYLLELGDRFDHKAVIRHCMESLEENLFDIDVIDRLQYAHDYKLPSIQNNCLNELNTEELILDAISNYDKIITPEVAELLFEKLMKTSSIPISPGSRDHELFDKYFRELRK